MKTRRRQGATLGLVAVCVLVIIVVGIGCFFLAKIFGGGREVANATDAGALNIAKNAMHKNDALVGVDSAGYPNFVYCADPPNSKITLMTYNRCVAQALLVAMNAKAENNPPATINAQAVLNELTSLGTALRTKLTDRTTMTTYFDKVKNDTRMFNAGASPVTNNSTYVTAFMKKKGSTNVYFTTNELINLDQTGAPLPAPLPPNWASNGTDKVPQSPRAAFNGSYLSGYDNLTVTGIGTIMGVPVFPQQNPHLVSKTDFDQSTGDPLANASIPPNAFSVASTLTEQKSGALGGAVAAAIVGASITQAGGAAANYDFPAAIPGGYIEIENLASGPVPANAFPIDNSDNIFNNELYLGPGIEMGSTSNGAVFFTTDLTAPDAWAQFNTSNATNISGTTGGPTMTQYAPDPLYGPRNKYLNPLAAHDPAAKLSNGSKNPTAFYTTRAPGASAAGVIADLLTLTNPAALNCLTAAGQLNATGQLNGSCQTYLPSFENAYSPPPSGRTTPPGQYSNVDVLKGQVIGAFQSGVQSVTVPTGGNPLPPSGLGVYNQNGFGVSPEPTFTSPLQTTGTIDALLNQVTTGPGANAGCTKANVLASMTQRCFEIKPDADPNDVKALWARTLPMGTTFYVYLNPAINKLDVLIYPQKPPTWTNTVLDGKPNGTSTDCSNAYGLDDTFVNVPNRGNGALQEADLDLHDRPYRNHNPGALNASDRANWQLSSGYGQVLGKLTFSNSVTGVENFSRPN